MAEAPSFCLRLCARRADPSRLCHILRPAGPYARRPAGRAAGWLGHAPLPGRTAVAACHPRGRHNRRRSICPAAPRHAGGRGRPCSRRTAASPSTAAAGSPGSGSRLRACRKSLAEFASADAKKPPIIFSGGMYGGENTARLANVRRARLRRALRALQRAAAPFKREPSETGLV